MWKEVTTICQLGQANIRHARRMLVQSKLVLPRGGRRFSAVSVLQASKKGRQEEDPYHDRTRLNPQRTEVSKSGTDQEAAGLKSAYDPTRTSPEDEFKASKEESRQDDSHGDPLDVSPANHEVSGARDPMEGGADRNVEKPGPSTRGWTKKAKEVNVPKKQK